MKILPSLSPATRIEPAPEGSFETAQPKHFVTSVAQSPYGPPERLEGMSDLCLVDMEYAVMHCGDDYIGETLAEDSCEDDNECPNCNGTGEGTYEGSVCHCCGGSGNGATQYDPDDFDIPDEDY